MLSSTCPFCNQVVPSSELERHANNHFVEEELAMDLELAHQIAFAPTSPVRVYDNEIDEATLFQILSTEDHKSTTSNSNAMKNCRGGNYIQEKISCLFEVQLKSPFYKVEGGLMALLRRCLEYEKGNSVTILSGYVDHFQSTEEDSGWGCGWRNIQMLSSHLLMQNPEAKEVLFGGSGFVPDIPSLQRWLEIAWERDIDRVGSYEFKHKVYGSTKWIGTTECATIFRSFGLRARIVDFGSKEDGPYCSNGDGANPGDKLMYNRDKRKLERVYGPIDKFFNSKNCGTSQADAFVHGKSKDDGIQSGDDSSTSTNNNNAKSMNQGEMSKCMERKIRGHQVITEWVWDYFSDKKFKESGNLQHVTVSEKMPLYFQHQGHSRTIVGIQLKKQPGTPNQYTLLVLDPGHRTEVLERSLRKNFGWQKLVKRGLHTLKKPQYQLCYVDPGIAHGEEMEHLKTIDSIYYES